MRWHPSLGRHDPVKVTALPLMFQHYVYALNTAGSQRSLERLCWLYSGPPKVDSMFTLQIKTGTMDQYNPHSNKEKSPISGDNKHFLRY